MLILDIGHNHIVCVFQAWFVCVCDCHLRIFCIECYLSLFLFPNMNGRYIVGNWHLPSPVVP